MAPHGRHTFHLIPICIKAFHAFQSCFNVIAAAIKQEITVHVQYLCEVLFDLSLNIKVKAWCHSLVTIITVVHGINLYAILSNLYIKHVQRTWCASVDKGQSDLQGTINRSKLICTL